MSHRPRILVVDDDSSVRFALTDILHSAGYSVETAADGFKALPKLEEVRPALLLTDIRPLGLDGISLMRRSAERDPDRPVILMAAEASVDNAVLAMRSGAADFLPKPLDPERVVESVGRALDRRRQQAEAQRRDPPRRSRIEGLLGASPAMQRVFDAILQVAPTRATVLITGESGTGKELVAAAIHRHSTRAGGPFVKLHCASLAESLLESELFGHERGSFTGAASRRDGRFQQADGGTLFLDEIGEISPNVQTKLLRFLQYHEFERVGGNETHHVDIRLVTATNRNLVERVRSSAFREDLFYRLNVVTIEMPPLRARISDIPILANTFLHRFAAENGRQLAGFTDAALHRLVEHDWPGNVRELENAIERAAVIARGPLIDAGDLSPAVLPSLHRPDAPPSIPGATLAELERYAILKTLEKAGGSPSKAAHMLDISTRKVQYKVREYASSRYRPAAGARGSALDGDSGREVGHG